MLLQWSKYFIREEYDEKQQTFQDDDSPLKICLVVRVVISFTLIRVAKIVKRMTLSNITSYSELGRTVAIRMNSHAIVSKGK